jgi:hypothetical protein
VVAKGYEIGERVLRVVREGTSGVARGRSDPGGISRKTKKN